MDTDKVQISVLLTAADSMFNDSDDSEDELLQAAMNVVSHSRPIPKITNYAELTVPQFDDDVFKSHFQVNRQTFQHLLQKTGALLAGGDACESAQFIL